MSQSHLFASFPCTNCWSTEVSRHNSLQSLHKSGEGERKIQWATDLQAETYFDEKGQRRMCGSICLEGHSDLNNHSLQPENTTRQTLTRMGFKNRRLHWVPVLSAKKRTPRLQGLLVSASFTKTWVVRPKKKKKNYFSQNLWPRNKIAEAHV